MASSVASPGSGKGCRPVVCMVKWTGIPLFAHGMVSRGWRVKEVEEEDIFESAFLSPRLGCFVLFRRIVRLLRPMRWPRRGLFRQSRSIVTEQ